MKKSILAFVCLLPSVSCADSHDSLNKTVSGSDKYVIGTSFDIESKLDKRLSLITNTSQRNIYVVHGTTEPTLIALSSEDNLEVQEGNEYQFISKDKAVLFELGPLDKDDYAEILDYKSKTPVGLIYYYADYRYPDDPSRLLELCTGAYENACNISFDSNENLYKIVLQAEQ